MRRLSRLFLVFLAAMILAPVAFAADTAPPCRFKMVRGLGIAFTFDARDRTLFVGEAIRGSVAEQVGMKTRDKIIAINGKPTADFEKDSAAAALINASRGKNPVILDLLRNKTERGRVSMTPGMFCPERLTASVLIPDRGDAEPTIVYEAKPLLEPK